MNAFLETLHQRNVVLYYAGLLCLLGTLVCVVLSLTTTAQVLGVNAYVKPAKFFISIAIFCWTMAWYTGLLPQRGAVAVYSWVVVITMALEIIIITGQAARGQLSHFNVTSALGGALFGLMGIAITVLTGWTAYIGYLFFKLPGATGLPPGYLWGIRLGILLFVVFAFEGFLMVTRLRHTVGAPDGGPGLPVANWSTAHGDLRVAHFFGMHALQLLPLLGYYVARRPGVIITVAAIYFLLVTGLLVQALAGRPLLMLR